MEKRIVLAHLQHSEFDTREPYSGGNDVEVFQIGMSVVFEMQDKRQIRVTPHELREVLREMKAQERRKRLEQWYDELLHLDQLEHFRGLVKACGWLLVGWLITTASCGLWLTWLNGH